MTTKKKKLIAIIVLAVAALVVLALAITACVLFAPRKVIKELPDEKIVSVVKVTRNYEEEETRSELSNEKIDSFYDGLKGLKYTEFYNFRQWKLELWDSKYYLINYENYTVKLSAHHLYLYRGEEKVKHIMLNGITPSDKYQELSNLFED